MRPTVLLQTSNRRGGSRSNHAREGALTAEFSLRTTSIGANCRFSLSFDMFAIRISLVANLRPPFKHLPEIDSFRDIAIADCPREDWTCSGKTTSQWAFAALSSWVR
jgi:hypothetical protein